MYIHTHIYMYVDCTYSVYRTYTYNVYKMCVCIYICTYIQNVYIHFL